KTLSDGDIGIVTVLHERMHQMDRFREDFGE
ncbi:MAG: type II toxin-antitoxin system RelE/ParE family toxin, partial [Acidobacteria bacterium]|nr:type II toxin-antitoxin system RelE/ParE family toxin [Acidobacteriota bacterium]